MGPRHPVKPEVETPRWRRQRREREKDVEEKARIWPSKRKTLPSTGWEACRTRKGGMGAEDKEAAARGAPTDALTGSSPRALPAARGTPGKTQ